MSLPISNVAAAQKLVNEVSDLVREWRARGESNDDIIYALIGGGKSEIAMTSTRLTFDTNKERAAAYLRV